VRSRPTEDVAADDVEDLVTLYAKVLQEQDTGTEQPDLEGILERQFRDRLCGRATITSSASAVSTLSDASDVAGYSARKDRPSSNEGKAFPGRFALLS
jgi:hypothetical protein